jgi:hypothetical protein
VAALFEALDSDEDHMNGHSDISIAVSLHSYTGCVMWPWGYTYGPAPHAALLEEIGRKMASFSGYDAYQSANMYLTSGDTSDWFYAAMGTLPFCIELGKGSDQGFHPKPSMIDNISMPNVQSLLYCAEIADVAKVAFDLTASSINLSIPRLEHTPRKEVAAGTELTLDVKVQNASSLAADGLRLFYHVKGGSWSSTGMKRVGEGKYSGSVPGQAGGTVVEYYFRAADTFNTTHTLPSYAPYDIFATRITGISGGALTWGGVAAVILVACLALVWRFKRHWFLRLKPKQKK